MEKNGGNVIQAARWKELPSKPWSLLNESRGCDSPSDNCQSLPLKLVFCGEAPEYKS